jgi:hypothetical protein
MADREFRPDSNDVTNARLKARKLEFGQAKVKSKNVSWKKARRERPRGVRPPLPGVRGAYAARFARRER